MLASMPLQHAHILLVDDQPSNIKILRDAVADLGDLYFATDGNSAIELAISCEPILVLLDIEMPGMDGYSVCQALKANPKTRDCAIIFVTSHHSADYEIRALESGGVDFIHKPLNVPVTRARIQLHLSLQRRTRLLAQARRDLADLVNTLPAFIALWDVSLHNLFCNDTNSRWFGITPAAMHQMHLKDVLGAKGMSIIQPYIDRIKSGENATFEMQIETKSGAIIYGQVTLVYRAYNGLPDGFLMLISDISERKLAEFALKNEKERINVTLNSIGDAVIATNTDGIIEFINPIAEELTGWTSADAIGRDIESVMILRDGGTGQILPNPIRFTLAERSRMGMAIDSVLTRRDGARFSVEDSAAPIRNHNNEVTGAIIVFHDVSEARTMASQMSYLTQHDALTGLPNRVLLGDRTNLSIKKAKRDKSKVSLILLDLDHFKTINDGFGHTIGDQLLQQIGQYLIDISREGDTVCRLGGDEFVILISDFDEAEVLVEIAQRALRISTINWRVEDLEFELSVSIGISIFPDDSDDLESLHKHADTAMYSAKQRGRNRFQFFSNELEQRLQIRLQLESQLKEAIANDMFEVFYQPKVDASTGHILGVEALVRWRRKDGSLVFPNDFIPIAEETGLIIPIGKAVIFQAFTHAKIWHDDGFDIRVAINISAAQFSDPLLIDHIKSISAQTGIELSKIDFEITESLLISDVAYAKAIVEQLKLMGMRISLDDFGTGYSSLSYLKTFPFDILKIDQSFVRNMLNDKSDETIIRAIVQMAEGLNLRLIAEGVETKLHADALVNLGCHIMQGYYYSKPVTFLEMSKLLEIGLPGYQPLRV